jgi:long-chain acyl-CoA synthetase
VVAPFAAFAGLFPSNAALRERPAVIDGDRVYRPADLWRLVAALAERLDRLSLPANSRIAVLLPNSAQAVAAVLAIAHAAHSCVPLNPGLKRAELTAILERCGVRAAFGDREVAGRLPDAVTLLAVEEILAGCGAGRDDGIPPWPAADLLREFVCLSTSGSSGAPRLVARSARAVEANLRQVAAALQVTAADRFLAVVPFWHANGFANCLLLPLSQGGSIVTLGRFLPRLVLETIRDARVSVVIGSPFVFKALSQAADAQPVAALAAPPGWGSVRTWISSGAALPAALDERLRGQGIAVRQLYGSSETGTLCLSGPERREPGSVGRPVAGVALRIVDGQGAEVAPGTSGEIEVRSAALFEGYVGDPSSGPPRTTDGFYRMGDLGRRNAADEVVLLGRSDAMINVSGVKVDPREVQAVLESLPGIAQALVHGMEDAAGLTLIRALLVRKGEISTEEVLRYCRRQLAEYKLPRVVEFVDSIPQDLMGKTARRLLEN